VVEIDRGTCPAMAGRPSERKSLRRRDIQRRDALLQVPNYCRDIHDSQSKGTFVAWFLPSRRRSKSRPSWERGRLVRTAVRNPHPSANAKRDGRPQGQGFCRAGGGAGARRDVAWRSRQESRRNGRQECPRYVVCRLSITSGPNYAYPGNADVSSAWRSGTTTHPLTRSE
jgi:hypothetical protein